MEQYRNNGGEDRRGQDTSHNSGSGKGNDGVKKLKAAREGVKRRRQEKSSSTVVGKRAFTNPLDDST
jgi:hypothetical protein